MRAFDAGASALHDPFDEGCFHGSGNGDARILADFHYPPHGAMPEATEVSLTPFLAEEATSSEPSEDSDEAAPRPSGRRERIWPRAPGDARLVGDPMLSDHNCKLAWAVHEGRVDDVVALLSTGVAVDVANSIGETPLFQAASSGQLTLTALLLIARADPTHRSHEGHTALHFATDPCIVAMMAAVAPPSAKWIYNGPYFSSALHKLPGDLRESIWQAMEAGSRSVEF